MPNENILKEIIEGYRNTIAQRYQYQNIQRKYEIPESMTEETVNSIRSYFLNYIYPEFEKRAELNEAFQCLDDYTKHPEKLLRALVDSVRLIFSHGRHLPKILKSGLKAMNTFKAATNFEDKLINKATNSKIAAPYDVSKINGLIKQLSRKEIQQFIDSAESLFEILHDEPLIKNIKEVIQTLISIMKKKQESYSLNEVKGHALFKQLTKEDQQKLVPFIIKIEQDTLDDIFLEK
jgi:hypothetical protein